ncbi:extracellular solute-binding protein [Paenibacillus hamazuiensis]|uniref:extracellular solute-binding protein n=1 Tax=Paenibacillus hamazuiensis TaxID=2936508 RepID=UPI00200C62BA|nr:extracellular solute-binding protein [Paenibacillus hamazuiensis]
MKRKWVAAAFGLVLATNMIGCSNLDSPANNANKSTDPGIQTEGDMYKDKTLVISAQAWIIDKWPLKEAAQKFMDAHPGVKVEIKPAPDKGEADPYLLQWSQGKTSFDLALGGSPADLSPYVAKGFLTEFDEAFFSKIGKDKFVKSLLDQGKFGGKQYAVPLLGEAISLNVNVDHMKEAGLVDSNGKPKAPKDWNELYDFAKKLTKTDNGKTVRYGLAVDLAANFINLNYYSGLVGTNNGKFLSDDGKTIDFTSGKAKDLLMFWQKLIKDGYGPSDGLIDANAGRNALKAGTVSMLWTASSRTQETEAVLGKGKVVNLPLPGTDTSGSIIFTHGMYIPKLSKNTELAKQFIQEQLLNVYGQQWSAEKFGKLPVISEYYDALDPGIKSLLAVMNNSKSEPLYQEQGKITELIHREVSKMLTSGQSVDETAAKLSTGFKALNVHMIQ